MGLEEQKLNEWFTGEKVKDSKVCTKRNNKVKPYVDGKFSIKNKIN